MIDFPKMFATHERVEGQLKTGSGAIRLALIEGEKSGICDQTPEDIRKEVLKRLSKDGELPTK